MGMIRLRRYPVRYSELGVDILLIGGGGVVVFRHDGERERCCGDERKRARLEATALGYL